jgi:hypothetical protein
LLAIRFLGLIEENGKTTDRLEDIATAKGALRQRLLRDTIGRAYRGILSGLNLEQATSGQLQEQFKNAGASGVTLRKCIAFFRSAIDDAGIPHSQYAGKRKAGRPVGARSAATLGHPPSVKAASAESTVTGQMKSSDTALARLAEKLPPFDQGWNEEMKRTWFETFRRILDLQSAGKIQT